MNKKLLFLTHQLPYPPDSGGKIVSWEVVEHFSQRCKLSLGCLVKPGDEKYLEKFKQQLSPEYFFYTECSRPRNIKTLIKSYIQNKPMSIFRNFSREFQNELQRVIPGIDILFCDHLEMCQYIPKDFHGKIIVLEHNAEFILWKRKANIERNIFIKKIIDCESVRIKQFEVHSCNRSDVVFCLSGMDKKHLMAAGVKEGKIVTTLTGGRAPDRNQPEPAFSDIKKTILFVGTLSWDANSDGLLWFLDRVWGRVKQKDDGIILKIIGAGANPELTSIISKDTRIKYLGRVRDIDQHYRSSRVMIAPLRYGSGIKIKIVDALCRGIPVVTTRIGAEGIPAENEKEILITDSPVDFAGYVIRLMNDEKFWTSVRDRSKVCAIKYFSWERTLTIMERTILG